MVEKNFKELKASFEWFTRVIGNLMQLFGDSNKLMHSCVIITKTLHSIQYHTGKPLQLGT